MGRRRERDRHLPGRMYRRRGVYFYAHKDGPWENLGREYGKALIRYAEIVGERPQVRTVADLLGAYVEDARGRCAAATVKNYELSAVNLCRVFGAVAIVDVAADDVYRYVVTIGNVQANRDRALLSAAYTHARRTGALPKGSDDPTKGLHYRNTEEPRARYLTNEELDAVIACASPKLACIIRFLELTGMRIGDALQLKMAALDDAGFLYWNSKGKKWQGLEWSEELTATVEDAKRLWRRFGREWLFESHPKGRNAARGVGPYTPRGLRSLWDRARDKAGVLDATLHDIRGKAGSDKGTDAEAQELLGHADSKVTRRHYRRKVTRTKPLR